MSDKTSRLEERLIGLVGPGTADPVGPVDLFFALEDLEHLGRCADS